MLIIGWFIILKHVKENLSVMRIGSSLYLIFESFFHNLFYLLVSRLVHDVVLDDSPKDDEIKSGNCSLLTANVGSTVVNFEDDILDDKAFNYGSGHSSLQSQPISISSTISDDEIATDQPRPASCASVSSISSNVIFSNRNNESDTSLIQVRYFTPFKTTPNYCYILNHCLKSD